MALGNYAPQSFISQAEASALAGVSSSTLMRFAEAGYFRVVKHDDTIKFVKEEICDVFGPAISSLSAIRNSTETPANSEDPIKQKSPEHNFKSDSENNFNDNNSTEKPPLNEQIEKSVSGSDFVAIHPASRDAGNDPLASDEKNEAANFDRASSLDAFRKVLQLQEELLAQKEDKIKDLLKERDWLRSRLEKMEDKADRDQMLLMVESQKVRTLIDKSSPKPGLIRLALDWIGGSSNKPAQQHDQTD